MFLTLLAGTIITNAVKVAVVTISAKTIFDASKNASEAITRKVLK